MAAKCFSEIDWLTDPHQILSRLVASSTMNLSLGERPVYSPVSTTNAPPGAKSPSPRLIASSYKQGAAMFQ